MVFSLSLCTVVDYWVCRRHQFQLGACGSQSMPAQGASLRAMPSRSSRSPGSDGGERAAWPESRPPQPPNSFSQRRFSHRRPVKSGVQWQRRLLWHAPPFWQRRSSLSHTRAVATDNRRREMSCSYTLRTQENMIHMVCSIVPVDY